MAATLKHLTQRALKAYTFADVDHPLVLAWSDYQHAKANALPTRDHAARLRRELRLEAMCGDVIAAA